MPSVLNQHEILKLALDEFKGLIFPKFALSLYPSRSRQPPILPSADHAGFPPIVLL